MRLTPAIVPAHADDKKKKKNVTPNDIGLCR